MGKTTGNQSKPPDPERTPQNLEAERMVLGYLLVGGAWREDVGADDFATERHQVIWRAMETIHGAGEAIDYHRVAVELGTKKLKHVGIGYLSDLGDGCYPEMRIDSYVNKLHDATVRRAVLHHVNVLSTHAFSGDRTADELVTMGADAFATLQRGRNHQEEPPTVPSWPDPIHEDGFHGIAGDLVRAIEPVTEADCSALLLQFLVAWGSLAGRGPHYLAEADYHHVNDYVVIVGTTSKGRKGTSWGRIGSVLGEIDKYWLENRLLSGIGSGEALFDAVNEEDRRTLVIEGEFARLLAVVARDGSTISANLRTAWDTGSLSVRTRQNKVKVSGAHLSLVGHITREELLRRLDSTEAANGFGNRILWVCARRSKVLPHGGGSFQADGLTGKLTEATNHAREMGNMRVNFDSHAAQLWEQVYEALSEGKPGLLGSMTSRAEAHVVRLALIYTLLDCSENIRAEHLRAALAVWNYCAASARFIWGDALGDPTADEILRALKAAGSEGLTRWDIHNHFSRHKAAGELDRALGVLTERGLIRSAPEQSGGRPGTRYWTL
jgi:hypothetical protein